MHITLTIQSFLSFVFVALLFAPLPVLILSATLGYLKDWFAYRNYRKIIERDYSHLELIDVSQLKEIFPHKKEEHLESLADYLNENRPANSYKY